MSYKLLICPIFLLTIFANQARAELKLIAEKTEIGGAAQYSHIVGEGDQQYWLALKYDEKGIWLSWHDFFQKDFNERQRIPLSIGPLITMQRSSFGLLPPLVVGNSRTGVQAYKLNSRHSAVEASGAVRAMSFVREVGADDHAYYLSGGSSEKLPTILRISKDLKQQEQILHISHKKGEIGNIFFDKEKRMYATVNYGDATSEFLEITKNGRTVRALEINGAGATVIPLRAGGFVATYAQATQVVVEKFDQNFKSQWVTKLHKLDTVSTSTDQLLELPDAIGFVGGIDAHLLVVRISMNGAVLQTSLDRRYDFDIPPRGWYMAAASGDTVHIRGQSQRKDDSAGSFTSFYFTETKDK